MHHHPQNQERALNLSILIVSGMRDSEIFLGSWSQGTLSEAVKSKELSPVKERVSFVKPQTNPPSIKKLISSTICLHRPPKLRLSDLFIEAWFSHGISTYLKPSQR